jgi:hypothetical protein
MSIFIVSMIHAMPKLRSSMLKGSFLMAKLEPIVPTTITEIAHDSKLTMICKKTTPVKTS